MPEDDEITQPVWLTRDSLQHFLLRHTPIFDICQLRKSILERVLYINKPI